MLDSKTIEAVVESMVARERAQVGSINIISGRGYVSAGIAQQIRVIADKSGFVIKFSLTETNPDYDPALSTMSTRRYSHPNSRKTIDTDFQYFNVFGPFSKIYKNLKWIVDSQERIAREKAQMEILTKINKVIDITGAAFEKDVLKG